MITNDNITMQNINQIITIYLQTLNIHMKNNADLWEECIMYPTFHTQEEQDARMNLWLQKHFDINSKFADQLFNTSLALHAEALEFFDKLLPIDIAQYVHQFNSMHEHIDKSKFV